jgi:hypothetical protein
MSRLVANEPVSAATEERVAWEKILFGISVIYVTIVAVPALGLLFGVLFTSVVDLPRIDWPTLVAGMIGFFFVYALGVAGIAVGLHAWCQVPSGFPGRGYAQSAFVLTLATSAVTMLDCRWLTDRLAGPWLASTHASLLDFMLAASGGLAVMSGLLFVRSVGLHLGERDLAEQASRRLRIFVWWLAGVILFAPLVEFLDVEAPWLRPVYGVWVWLGGAAVLLAGIALLEQMRRALRRATG